MNKIHSVTIHTSDNANVACLNDYWMLIYCTAGTGMITLSDGRGIEYAEGNIAVIPPSLCHTVLPYGEYSDIRIQMDSPSFYFGDTIVIADNPQKFLRASFEQAFRYFCTESANYEHLLDSLGTLIANYVLALNKAASYTSPVSKIHYIILRNFTDCDFTLDDTIRQMPFHYDYLRKRFKNEVGMTPREFLTKLRMERARSLLTGPGVNEHNVSEIAQQCSFRDPLYFSRTFKKYFGVCPSSYSKMFCENTETK